MRCASKKRLERMLDLDAGQAATIRMLAHLADEPKRLAEYIQNHCPRTHRYARSCRAELYDSPQWRRTVIMHACDDVIGTCGVMEVGDNPDADFVRFECCNPGDPWVQTLVIDKVMDALIIEAWGDLVWRSGMTEESKLDLIQSARE